MISTRRNISLGFSLLLAAATAAAQVPAVTPVPPLTQPATPAAAPAPEQLPDSPGQAFVPHVPTGPTVVFDTTAGRMTCKLFDKEAPLAATNFVQLAEGTKDWVDPNTGEKMHNKRFYDGVSFHRVIPGFMVQGGDRHGDGTGDAGFAFANEVVRGLDFDVAGRLAMANAGPNTNGTQFFITELPQPDLNGGYTIFGQCDAHSVLIVATIARVNRDTNDKPVVPIYMNKVTIVRDGQPMPPEPTAPAGSGPQPR